MTLRPAPPEHGIARAGFVRRLLAALGMASFLLASQVPYLTGEAVRSGLAAGLTAVAGVGLAWLGMGRFGQLVSTPRLVLWTLLALGLWAPALITTWRAALAPCAHAFLAITLAGVALTLLGMSPSRRRNGASWAFIVMVLAILAVAELGRDVVGIEKLQLQWALLWAAIVLGALIGWGRLVALALLPRQHVDWGLAGALGMAAACAVTGIANLTWTISPTIVNVFLALGAASWATTFAENRRLAPPVTEENSIHPVVATALIIAVALQLAGAVAGTVDTVYQQPAVDRHDDAQAYLVFPRTMLETGSMGSQPWEARRMLSLGAQSGLQALILAANPVRAIHLLDAGVSMVLLVGLVLGGARRWQLGSGATALVAAVALTAPHLSMRGNTSAVLTGTVLLLALFRLMDEASDETSAAPAGIALIAAAAIAVKSTLAPAVVVTAGIGLLAPLAKSGRRWPTLIAVAGTATATGLLLLPWMISVLESSATLLYPVLGKGFFGGVYHAFPWAEGTFEVTLATRFTAVAKHGVILLPILVLLAAAGDRSPRRAATATALGAVAALFVLILVGDPRLNRSLARYAFPATLAATLGLLTATLRLDGSRLRRTGPAIGVAVAVLMALGRPDAVADLYGKLVRNIVRATSAPAPTLASEEERAAMAAIQEVVPSDALLLSTLEQPWLLDASRLRLRILSLPGWSSPPPGLGLDRSSATLADGLEDQGVRYLAYGGRRDLGDLLTLTEKQIRERYRTSKMRWAILRGHELYRERVNELADSRKRLYDDDRRIVLDLASPAATIVPEQRPDRCEGFLMGGWTTGNALVRGLPAPSNPATVVVRTAERHPAWHADPGSVVVSVDGRPLPLQAGGIGYRAYRLHPAPTGPFDLEIRSPALPAAELGARSDGSLLGVDVTAVEVVSDPGLAAIPIHTLIQPVEGDLNPETIWRRAGFYRDNGWTNGAASLAGLDWKVSAGATVLEIELHPAHPQAGRPEELDLHVFANGLDLVPVAFEPRTIRYRLPPRTKDISEIEIRSTTFVPSAHGQSTDNRTLGVPVRRLSLRKQ